MGYATTNDEAYTWEQLSGGRFSRNNHKICLLFKYNLYQIQRDLTKLQG